MRELDDAALERRLREVLEEHLGALPLDLTVDALDRRREAKGVCPTIRPGPRHHASRGRSPGARRWGVGGGLRPPAAAVGRPARACPSFAVRHDCVAGATTTPTPSASASPSPTPSLDLDMDAGRRSMSKLRRVSRGSAIASCWPTRNPARSDLHRWPELAGTAAWRRCPGYVDLLQGSFASWQDSAVGWWNPQDQGPTSRRHRRRSPLVTSCTTVHPAAAPTSTTPFKGRIESIGIGPKGIVAEVHSDLDWDAWVTKKLGLRTNNDWTCAREECRPSRMASSRSS